MHCMCAMRPIDADNNMLYSEDRPVEAGWRLVTGDERKRTGSPAQSSDVYKQSRDTLYR